MSMTSHALPCLRLAKQHSQKPSRPAHYRNQIRSRDCTPPLDFICICFCCPGRGEMWGVVQRNNDTLYWQILSTTPIDDQNLVEGDNNPTVKLVWGSARVTPRRDGSRGRVSTDCGSRLMAYGSSGSLVHVLQHCMHSISPRRFLALVR